MTNTPPVVVITGAFGALGRAVAEAFATRGAQLALLDVAPQPPAAVRDLLGRAPLLFGGVDLTDLEATRRGRAVFNGKAIVHEGAQQSQARQTSRNLLLTPGAEIDTKPELEIYADDVQCSHGATTGQLDAAALFYLRSRGLSETEARSALTRAFAGAVLSRMDHAAFAAAVHDMLDARLERLLETGP